MTRVTRVFAAPRAVSLALGVSLGAACSSCSRFGPVYPPRPAQSAELPAADPEPTRIVAHLVVTSAALRAALDDVAPRSGEGTVRFLGSDRPYTWERGALDVGFSQGRVVLKTQVVAHLSVAFKSLQFPLDLRVEAEPIVSSEYAVRLQSVDVQVRSSDSGLAVADRVASIYERIATPIADRLKEFAYDLRPLLSEAYERVARPIETLGRRRPGLRSSPCARCGGRTVGPGRRYREGHRARGGALDLASLRRRSPGRARLAAPDVERLDRPARAVHGHDADRGALRRAHARHVDGVHGRKALLLGRVSGALPREARDLRAQPGSSS